jgi:hypothetical protein
MVAIIEHYRRGESSPKRRSHMKKLKWLALAGAMLASTAAVAAQPPVVGSTKRECTLAACFVYQYAGEINGMPIWILLYVEPRGGPNVN